MFAGDGFNALVSSSAPMPDSIHITLEMKTVSSSEKFKEPATKADATSPKTSSQHPAEPFPGLPSYDYSDIGGLLAAGLIVFVIIWVWDPYAKKDGFRKEEEKLKTILPGDSEPCRECIRTQKKELAEKQEALDREQLEHCRLCDIVLKVEMEKEEVLFETDGALESAREAGNARVLAEGTSTAELDGETGNHSPIVLVMVLASSLGLGVSIGMCIFGIR